ncbi:hypothetical protein [Cohnella cholangitidis]|uniref:MarR family transcriptional regulator n=1 Tax=Cohnella cholangitidis TaxID=2598458 RepID=A0A7G5C3H2_9BACL|nr:hypothetical protein [Cohnella cholangitidis]QMV43756.1 hypothetical protein FPL14_23215 [Cohnella cholangitidis]
MLDDTSRKILRILNNMRYVPTMDELARKAGRSPEQVKIALRVLATERFIEYAPDRHHELKIIQAWEFQQPKPQPMFK